MNDDKKIMSIFAQAYQLIAQASKLQPSLEGFQLILEILGEDGIQECAKVADLGPEAVAQAMIQIIQQKQTQKAANGAKLRYLMLLKGICPLGYLKKGGKCEPCEMAKGAFGNKADMFDKGGNFTKNKYEEEIRNGLLNKYKKSLSITDWRNMLPDPYNNLDLRYPKRYNKQEDDVLLASNNPFGRKLRYNLDLNRGSDYEGVIDIGGNNYRQPDYDVPGFMPGIEGYGQPRTIQKFYPNTSLRRNLLPSWIEQLPDKIDDERGVPNINRDPYLTDPRKVKKELDGGLVNGLRGFAGGIVGGLAGAARKLMPQGSYYNPYQLPGVTVVGKYYPYEFHREKYGDTVNEWIGNRGYYDDHSIGDRIIVGNDTTYRKFYETPDPTVKNRPKSKKPKDTKEFERNYKKTTPESRKARKN